MSALLDYVLTVFQHEPQHLGRNGLDILIEETEGKEALRETRCKAIELKLERELCS